jgi:sialate O-acetylesterase
LAILAAPAAAATGTSDGGVGLLAGIFRDHAVLQRDKPISVWGHAASGEGISISLGHASVRAQTDISGVWRASLPPMSAGGPFILTVQSGSGRTQTANDVLIGDVFLCSGQSNMELPVERTGDARNEIDNSTNSSIRMLTIQHASSATPRAEFSGPLEWQLAAPATVPNWSAACFYFARELQKTQHVPIGLVHSSWGGTNIRPWLSTAAYRTLGGYDLALSTLSVYAKDEAAAQGQFGEQWEAWWRDKTGDRRGDEPWVAHHGTGWQAAPAGLGDWRFWGTGELHDFTGLIWYRAHFTLTASQARALGQGAVRLDLGPINQVDETWVNGHVVGNTFGYGTERTYSVPAGVVHSGDNVLVVNVLSTYGGGGLLAGGTQRALRLPSGESIPLEGPWDYRVVPATVGYPPRAPWEPIGGVTALYNAMIAPLGSYGLRGVLWYQGESNTGEWESYRALLGALMVDWRRQLGPDLPFLVVQLPNYGPPPIVPAQQSGWASLREAQRGAVAADAHAGLVITIDIGEPGNLHPTNKQDVGRRLAHAARHVVYGESIPPSGPVASSASWLSGNQIGVDFRDVEGGLVTYSHARPIGFELCAQTPQSCRFAQSSIAGNKIVLPAPPDGPRPTRVRYCWADSPVCTLFDRSGLPAGPFELSIATLDEKGAH